MQEQLKNLQLLVLDVDGVLTDGKLYYTADGETQKVFDVKDGLGIKLALKEISVAILSGNPSPVIEKRAKDLGVRHCFVGIANKKDVLENLMKELTLTKKEVAYIGDDLNDLVVREIVGCFVCPVDAHKIILEKSDLVLSRKGGSGAVREFIDMLLDAKGSSSKFSFGVKEKNT